MKERQFIDWIRSRTALDPETVPVGPGDDCAVMMIDGKRVLATTDQALDGVHFVLSEHGGSAAGRKAMARNLSDVAAMAAVPVAALATVALPRSARTSQAEDIYNGMREIADRFDCPIVGGDVGVWSGPLAISVTVFGRTAGNGKPVGPILRSGAVPGDAICVTGRLGGAWRSRRHLTFTPRIEEAITLARKYEIHAMIDISDGLAADLHHICEESRVGARVAAEEIPIHEDAKLAGPETQDALSASLGDGEDYELLFALPPQDAHKLIQDQPLGVCVSRIGEILPGDRVSLVGFDGKDQDLLPEGWEHATGNGD